MFPLYRGFNYISSFCFYEYLSFTYIGADNILGVLLRRLTKSFRLRVAWQLTNIL